MSKKEQTKNVDHDKIGLKEYLNNCKIEGIKTKYNNKIKGVIRDDKNFFHHKENANMIIKTWIVKILNKSEFISNAITYENKEIEKDIKNVFINIKEKRQDGILLYTGSSHIFVTDYDHDIYIYSWIVLWL